MGESSNPWKRGGQGETICVFSLPEGLGQQVQLCLTTKMVQPQKVTQVPGGELERIGQQKVTGSAFATDRKCPESEALSNSGRGHLLKGASATVPNISHPCGATNQLPYRENDNEHLVFKSPT